MLSDPPRTGAASRMEPMRLNLPLKMQTLTRMQAHE
jgi:hypothetical protein